MQNYVGILVSLATVSDDAFIISEFCKGDNKGHNFRSDGTNWNTIVKKIDGC
ncbi:hypothetical protein IMZ48_36645 [Candidatus Bathyarchaeota archaeon]|nr:hypothetical protein [Candidatus Bathyarchaeota archaeon]